MEDLNIFFMILVFMFINTFDKVSIDIFICFQYLGMTGIHAGITGKWSPVVTSIKLEWIKVVECAIKVVNEDDTEPSLKWGRQHSVLWMK